MNCKATKSLPKNASPEPSVPACLRGVQTIMERVKQRPYVITFRWSRYAALVCVDLERQE